MPLGSSAIRGFASSRPLVTIAAVATVFAAAGFGTAVTISETTFSGVFGGITSVGTSLQISSTSIGVVKSGSSASGSTQGSAVEMSTGASGSGNTALTRAHWVYSVTIEETAVASVEAGSYAATLYKDDVSLGVLYFTQGTSNSAAIEGVTLKWDVGADLPSGDTSFRVEITSA